MSRYVRPWVPASRLSLVDIKKKEFIGNYQNTGRQWRKQNFPAEVNGRMSAAAGLLMAAALSLAVEAMQAWLPTRDSSLADFIANTAGAGVGVAGFTVWMRRLQRSRQSL